MSVVMTVPTAALMGISTFTRSSGNSGGAVTSAREGGERGESGGCHGVRCGKSNIAAAAAAADQTHAHTHIPTHASLHPKFETAPTTKHPPPPPPPPPPSLS